MTEQLILVNIALDGGSAFFLMVTILPLLARHHRTKPMRLLAVAEGLHWFALVLKVAAGLNLLSTASYTQANSNSLTAALLDAASATALLGCIMTDADGRLRLWKRVNPLPLNLMAAALVPVILALIIESFLFRVGLLGLVYSASLGLVQILLALENSRVIRQREEELDIRQARLLVDQIRPHFISNALMSIRELCYTDPEAAAARIDDFAGYLRGNMAALTSEELIPFNRELEHIKAYAALEKADPSRRFTLDFDLQAGDFALPALTLQPIVENAIRHGALSRRDGQGRVLVRTEAIGRFVRVTVTDNGTGEAALTTREQEHVGVAMKNVETRLNKLCQGTLALTRTPEGARAVITIPRMEMRYRAHPQRG
ncbi:MAG: histidine kinase [Clostridia bacterium]|nr:histidine kinase [Clostridia bacterium]